MSLALAGVGVALPLMERRRGAQGGVEGDILRLIAGRPRS
jgi:hypothetical protein